MSVIHLLTPEYLPKLGGVADYTRLVAAGLAGAGEEVHVWCAEDGHGDGADRFAVHPDLGRFRTGDLARAGKLLDAFSGPRRLIVQWVPHGYGFRSMNIGLCLWLWGRARRGDEIELMVHEPYLALWEGTWRQTAAAMVHRIMTVVLLRAACRVWVAIPAWEPLWKPYTLRRAVPFAWLPIPSSLPSPDRKMVGALHARLGNESTRLVGHLGTYGPVVAPFLMNVLPRILREPDPVRIILIGSGSRQFRSAFLERHPECEHQVYATGSLDELDLAAHVAACDLLIQPYPDGISSRRTSAMAGLCFGIPVVTTRGHLTESFWDESGAVSLTDVGDSINMAARATALLRHHESRMQLGAAGHALYCRAFDVSRTIAALRGAEPGRAA